jgi:hypothetical protein
VGRKREGLWRPSVRRRNMAPMAEKLFDVYMLFDTATTAIKPRIVVHSKVFRRPRHELLRGGEQQARMHRRRMLAH